MILKIMFVLINITILCIPLLMFYLGMLKKQDCRFKTLLKLSIRSILILIGSIFVVVVSKVTWWAIVAFSLFHLLNILLFKGQRKMDTFLR